jgi:hypothetical protein
VSPGIGHLKGAKSTLFALALLYSAVPLTALVSVVYWAALYDKKRCTTWNNFALQVRTEETTEGRTETGETGRRGERRGEIETGRDEERDEERDEGALLLGSTMERPHCLTCLTATHISTVDSHRRRF